MPKPSTILLIFTAIIWLSRVASFVGHGAWGSFTVLDLIESVGLPTMTPSGGDWGNLLAGILDTDAALFMAFLALSALTIEALLNRSRS